MLLDETPLPDGADKEDEWEKKIHQLIGDEDDTEGDNNKPYHDERTVDAEGTFYLLSIEAQQQRDEDDTQ